MVTDHGLSWILANLVCIRDMNPNIIMSPGPNEVIVYHGQADYLMGQAIQSGYVFIAMCAAAAFIAAFLLAHKLHECVSKRRWHLSPVPSFIAAGLVALATIYLMV